MSMAAALPSGGVPQPSARTCKRMFSDIDEDTSCQRPTKKQQKTDDFTDEEEAGAVCGGCFQYPRPMEGLPHHHEAGSREEADRPLRLPCMETGTASDRLMKKWRKTDESTDEEEADCDESVEKLEKVAELEVLRAGGGRASRKLLALVRRGEEKAREALQRVSYKYSSAVVARKNLLGDGRRIQELEEAVDKGLDGGQNRGDGLSNESRELLTLARKGDEKARKALQRLARSWKSSAMVALDIWFREASVEELEKMVNLGQDAAPSEGLSDVSRELLARARLGKKEACEALQRLATLGRSSAIAAQRLLFGASSGMSTGVPNIEEVSGPSWLPSWLPSMPPRFLSML